MIIELRTRSASPGGQPAEVFVDDSHLLPPQDGPQVTHQLKIQF